MENGDSGDGPHGCVEQGLSSYSVTGVCPKDASANKDKATRLHGENPSGTKASPGKWSLGVSRAHGCRTGAQGFLGAGQQALWAFSWDPSLGEPQ